MTGIRLIHKLLTQVLIGLAEGLFDFLIILKDSDKQLNSPYDFFKNSVLTQIDQACSSHYPLSVCKV